MAKNMGKMDRIIRTVLAVLFIVLFLTKVVTGTLGVFLLVLAVVFLITSLISYCPIYSLFKVNTNRNL